VHYQPERLMNGRVAVVGHAAHAASPMVGGGFRQGLYDVRALAAALVEVTSSEQVAGALDHYQRARLVPARQHVARSEQATAAYLAQAGV
jgi:2-polyprenyl-6-methoxyphenol hydroxylase-like FAD-dependent oxidoreductase